MAVRCCQFLQLRLVVEVGIGHPERTGRIVRVGLDVFDAFDFGQIASDRGGALASEHVGYFERHQIGIIATRRAGGAVLTADPGRRQTDGEQHQSISLHGFLHNERNRSQQVRNRLTTTANLRLSESIFYGEWYASLKGGCGGVSVFAPFASRPRDVCRKPTISRHAPNIQLSRARYRKTKRRPAAQVPSWHPARLSFDC